MALYQHLPKEITQVKEEQCCMKEEIWMSRKLGLGAAAGIPGRELGPCPLCHPAKEDKEEVEENQEDEGKASPPLLTPQNPGGPAALNGDAQPMWGDPGFGPAPHAHKGVSSIPWPTGTCHWSS